MTTYEQQKLGLSAYSHQAHRALHAPLTRVHGRQFNAGQDNWQFFANKAAFGPVTKPIHDRLVRFNHGSVNPEDFQ